MNEDNTNGDLLGDAAKGVNVLKTVMDIAGQSPELKDAGRNIAITAKTVTSLVNNCLLPIAVVNFAFEKGKRYFETHFAEDLQQATAHILPENVVEPKANVAAPILQGLTFSHEDDDLKTLYLNLLSTAMNEPTAEEAHPAFVDVIRQLASIEAKLLKPIFSSNGVIAIAQLRRNLMGQQGYDAIINHVLNFSSDNSEQVPKPQLVRAAVDNWSRLGIVRVSYEEHLTNESAYEWVNETTEMRDFKAGNPKHKIDFKKGILRLTDFGKAFREAVTSN